jgi:hypothetical protein
MHRTRQTLRRLTHTLPHNLPVAMSTSRSPRTSTLKKEAAKVIWNIGIQPPHYMAQRTRKPQILNPKKNKFRSKSGDIIYNLECMYPQNAFFAIMHLSDFDMNSL